MTGKTIPRAPMWVEIVPVSRSQNGKSFQHCWPWVESSGGYHLSTEDEFTLYWGLAERFEE